jgi:hypothetical protein
VGRTLSPTRRGRSSTTRPLARRLMRGEAFRTIEGLTGAGQHCWREGGAWFAPAGWIFEAFCYLAAQSVIMSSRTGRARSGGRSCAVPMWMKPATFSPARTPRAARAPVS